MPQFNSLQFVYRGSVKDIYQDDNNQLYFNFSDRYSIYDWGEMPDHILEKGNALASMGHSFFKFLNKTNCKHHFRDQVDLDLEPTKESSIINVQKVNVLKPTKDGEFYNYDIYQDKVTNSLVPLEVIFRLGLPEGSSFFKRANNPSYLKAIGVEDIPAQGEFFQRPIVEFSTKLEPMDRFLTYQEAQNISGLSDTEFQNLIQITQDLSLHLSELLTKMGLELWDGKFEFAFDDIINEQRTFKLVDTIGLDELRINKDRTHLSKEILRQYYQGSNWLNQMPFYKKQYGDHWKKMMLTKGLRPEKLAPEFSRLVSLMYTAFAKDLKLAIDDKEVVHIKSWKKEYDNYLQSKQKNILLIGNGGREHAIAWKLLKSKNTANVFIVNDDHAMLIEDGIKVLKTKVEKSQDFISDLKTSCINFVVIGPEAPLVDGLADFLREHQFVVFGPGKLGAKLEASKDFSKQIMQRAGIPTAEYQKFIKSQDAIKFINTTHWKDGYVIKADGLASGKGVIVTTNKDDAIKAVNELMVENSLGLSDTTIIIEQRLIGSEVSIFALIDKNTFKTIGNACDYKRIRDNDQGPNTGGMGTYSPCEWLTEDDINYVDKNVFLPLVKQLNIENIPCNGVIFAGLMKTAKGLKVLEFNVRFGDPETQSLLPRIENDFADLLHKTAANKLSEIQTIHLKDETVVNVVCAAFGYPGTEGTPVRKNDTITFDFNYQESSLNSKVFFAGVKKEGDSLFTSGGRVLGITCWGKDKSEARTLAYNNINKIHFEGMQYRHDIAK